MKNYIILKWNISNEEKMKELQRKEVEEEYLKNIKKYEEIMQDNQELNLNYLPHLLVAIIYLL